MCRCPPLTTRVDQQYPLQMGVKMALRDAIYPETLLPKKKRAVRLPNVGLAKQMNVDCLIENAFLDGR